MNLGTSNSGQCISVVGRSDSGKTTLARQISQRLLKSGHFKAVRVRSPKTTQV